MVGERGAILDPQTEPIIKSIIAVHKELGPGFLESIYKRALLFELARSGSRVEIEKEIVISYRGTEVGRHRLDLVVDGLILVEAKAVEAISSAHYAQMRSYLRASGLPVGLLANFAKERADFRRVEFRK